LTTSDEAEVRAASRLGFFSTLAVGVVLSIYATVVAGIYFGLRDGWLEAAWNNLEGDGRANVISSVITAVGLLSSAVILPFVFKDRISSLSDMVDKTERDLAKLGQMTEYQLTELTAGFRQQLGSLEDMSNRNADESRELVSAMYSAVTTLLGQGKVTDSEHARVIVHGLWEKAKYVCRQKLDNKSYLHQETKDKISSMRQMTHSYFEELVGRNIITSTERTMLLELRGLHYARTPPSPQQFSQVTRLQEELELFSKAVDENGNGGDAAW